MSFPQPFTPATNATTGTTVKVIANNNPTSVAGTMTAAVSAAGSNIRVVNAGTVLCFVRISAEATPTATAADIPMLAGSSEMFSNPAYGGAVGLACLSSTTTSCDVYFTAGQGS